MDRLKSQPGSPGVNDLTAQYEQQERFVDAARASNFLCCSRKHLLHLARTGQVPAHPFGGGSRKSWLFRLSELAAFVLQSKGNRLQDGSRAVFGNGDQMSYQQGCLRQVKRKEGTGLVFSIPHREKWEASREHQARRNRKRVEDRIRRVEEG